jgi:hypothetical protein
MQFQMKKVLLVGVAMLFGLGLVPRSGKTQGTATALLSSLKSAVDQNSAASDKMKTFAKETLIPLCTNPVFVQEVTTQNEQNISLDEIKKIDQEWIDAEDELPIQNEKLNNACAAEIKRIAEANPAILEAFVMDNQGALVGSNNLTSDYWQGDEAKWKESYKNGEGGACFGEVEFDKSANAELQQVSLPIVNAEGKVVGAATFGIQVGKL